MLESIGGKGLVPFRYRLVVRWLFLICKVPDRIRNAAMAQLVAQLICISGLRVRFLLAAPSKHQVKLEHRLDLFRIASREETEGIEKRLHSR